MEAAGFELEGFRAGVWKPRTRPGGFEGVGEEALQWLRQVQDMNRLPSMTEVASPAHLECALNAGITSLWIGSRTVTNPFDVQALADVLQGSGATVFVKNPINPDAQLWMGAIERIARAGITSVRAIHRGFSFYEKSKYRNHPKWQVPIEVMQRMPQVPMYCDPSHISGCREYIREISQMALDLGFAGLFVESHIHPECALSDSLQQLTPDALADLLETLVIKDDVCGDDSFEFVVGGLRSEIDLVDDNILDLIAQRMFIVERIGEYKKQHSITVLQPSRWEEIQTKMTQGAIDRGLDPIFIRELAKLLHQASIERQR